VPYAITITEHRALPNVVLDNLIIEGNTPAVVLVSGGATILEGKIVQEYPDRQVNG